MKDKLNKNNTQTAQSSVWRTTGDVNKGVLHVQYWFTSPATLFPQEICFNLVRWNDGTGISLKKIIGDGHMTTKPWRSRTLKNHGPPVFSPCQYINNQLELCQEKYIRVLGLENSRLEGQTKQNLGGLLKQFRYVEIQRQGNEGLEVSSGEIVV